MFMFDFSRQGQICFPMDLYGPYPFIWGKMLRIHILEISSIDYDLNELKINEEHWVT